MTTEKNGLLVEILPLFSRIPPLPPYFVSRPHKEQEIIRLIEKSLEQLEQSSNLTQNIVVLYGPSGYGKTTLALAICHNPHIKEIFSGDISWIDIEKKDINFKDGELKQNLTDRRCLVVLDNLWEISKLKKFLREGIFSCCTWLITTQRIEGIRQCQIDISCGYPKVQTVDIDGMSHNEAEQLLRYGLPEVNRNKLKRLVDRLYEVPLLINFIREKIWERVSENEDLIDQALDSVIEDLKAGIYKVVTYYDEQEWWKRFTVFSECLTKEEQEYFKELFIFPSHVEIPFPTVGKLWNPDLQLSEIRYICEKFKKLSLVKCIQNTIILNDFLRKYWIDDELKKNLPYLHYKLVKAYEDLPGGTKLAKEEETYLRDYLRYHWRKASKRDQKVSSKSSVKRNQVFISYSHKDNKWLDKLQTMLKPMIRNNSISVWADTAIKPGSKWRDEIEKALAAANVAVLMVSQNFLASDFIVKHELPPLLNAAEQEGLKIIWVHVGYCLYEETEIEQYQAAHNPSQPLENLRSAKRNQVLREICKEIKAATESPTQP